MRVIKGFLAAALLLASYAASATPWYWDDWHIDAETVTRYSVYEYDHDITGGFYGYRPGIDSIDTAKLTVKLGDDSFGDPGDVPWYLEWLFPTDGEETAAFQFDGNTWQVYSNPIEHLTTFDFIVTSLLQDGKLNIRITANTGDFLFGISHLEARGNRSDGSTSIPEPAMLSMLGFGLLGLGFFARRRRV